MESSFFMIVYQSFAINLPVSLDNDGEKPYNVEVYPG